MLINGLLPKLGRRPAWPDPRTLRLANYRLPLSLPTVPQAFAWTAKLTQLGMMLNDRCGDCTCATAGHMIQEWTAYAATQIVPSDNAILAAYEAVSGYDPRTGQNDNGAVSLDVLKYWRQTGIAGHKIGGFAAVDPANHQEVIETVYLFGACYIGIALPLSAQGMNSWDVPSYGPRGPGAPGSWGGHAVPVTGYDSTGLTVITWGRLLRMSWAFWAAYVEEAWAVISSDWISGSGQAPSGFDWQTLSADLATVTGTNPGPIVNPPPVPSPSPLPPAPPAPVPPAPQPSPINWSFLMSIISELQAIIAWVQSPAAQPFIVMGESALRQIISWLVSQQPKSAAHCETLMASCPCKP